MRSNAAELRELLHHALTVGSERQQIIGLQNAGQSVAQQFMAAGQRVILKDFSLHFALLNILLVVQELLLLRGAPVSEDSPSTPRISSPLSPQFRDSQRYLQYQRGLINLHRETGIPPTIKVLNGEVSRTGDLAVAGGTYSDIWLGLWLGEEKVFNCFDPPKKYHLKVSLGRPKSFAKCQIIRSSGQKGRCPKFHILAFLISVYFIAF
jgi:hypothetical protein